MQTIVLRKKEVPDIRPTPLLTIFYLFYLFETIKYSTNQLPFYF